jgi:hypothetical protein
MTAVRAINSVVRRLIVPVILATAVFTGAVRLPASVCPVADATIGKACHQGCCANMKCCADSKKNHGLPSAPAVKDSGANQQLVALPISNRRVLSAEMPLFERAEFVGVKSLDCSRPQLAVLCSFLI